MKNIGRIYEALLNRTDTICPKSDIVEIISEYKRKFSSPIAPGDALKYLSRHDYIKRVFQGYYYVNSVDERKRGYCSYEDRELLFIVLDRLGMRWYVGLQSALYLTGKSWQVPTTLHIITNSISGTRNVLGLRVAFSKIKEPLFFGLRKGRTRNGVRYLYSSPTKTSLDMVYLKKSGHLVRDAHTKKYLKHYPKWLGRK